MHTVSTHAPKTLHNYTKKYFNTIILDIYNNGANYSNCVRCLGYKRVADVVLPKLIILLILLQG